MTRFTLCLAYVVLGILPALAQSQTPRRVALVVGNAAYADAPLKNPANDAEDLAAKLQSLGFAVTKLTNRNRSQLTAAIRDFGRSAAGADAALFYFAGHGVQVRGKNYLLPVGQRFVDEAEVETDAVDVNTVLARLEEAGARVSLLVLDACRSNPLQRSGRGAVRGLARMEAPSGALVAFSAQPGAEAQDGDGRNGLFTKYLLEHIDTPGASVEQVFKRVRADVERETGRRQSPREESSLTADFSFSLASTGAAGRSIEPVRQATHSLSDAPWQLGSRLAAPGDITNWPVAGEFVSKPRYLWRTLEGLGLSAGPWPCSGSDSYLVWFVDNEAKVARISLRVTIAPNCPLTTPWVDALRQRFGVSSAQPQLGITGRSGDGLTATMQHHVSPRGTTCIDFTLPQQMPMPVADFQASCNRF